MTTPTSAANATGLSDRRHFLSTFAVAGLLTGTAAVPALASAPGPIEAMWQAAGAARRAHVDAIFATEASTPRELAFQAAILDIDWDQAAAERVLERLVELTGVTPFALA